jgi:hypothetical protein
MIPPERMVQRSHNRLIDHVEHQMGYLDSDTTNIGNGNEVEQNDR